MIFKTTIIALLTFGSVAIAQPGKSDHSSKKSKMSNSNEGNQHDSKQKNKLEARRNDRPNFVQQGAKENKRNSETRHLGVVDNQQHKQGGKNKGSTRPFKNNSNVQFQQKGGKGNKGGKPFKIDKHKQVKFQKNHSDNKKQYKGHLGKAYKGHNNKGHSAKPHKMKYGKGHPNFGYLYINTPGYYSRNNYGYWRSMEAKKKHKKYHPVYEYQAVEGFNFIIVRNNFLYTETDNKIKLVRFRLAEKRKAGQITVVEYDNSMRSVMVLEQRRAGLEVNLVL
jgi:hypothetical protein